MKLFRILIFVTPLSNENTDGRKHGLVGANIQLKRVSLLKSDATAQFTCVFLSRVVSIIHYSWLTVS